MNSEVTMSWVVYKQSPGHRGELQGGVLEAFELFLGEFSVNFRRLGRKCLELTKMSIARNHEVNQVPELVEMNPTSLPELSKQLRDQNTSS